MITYHSYLFELWKTGLPELALADRRPELALEDRSSRSTSSVLKPKPVRSLKGNTVFRRAGNRKPGYGRQKEGEGPDIQRCRERCRADAGVPVCRMFSLLSKLVAPTMKQGKLLL
jgi:hypothetical protein